MQKDKEFMEAIHLLPISVSRALMKCPETIRNTAREIRLRAGRSTIVLSPVQNFILPNILSAGELYECYRALCGYSIHTHTEEIKRGFLTIKGGHRAGLCGTAVYENGEISNLRGISSINLRVARQVKGCADDFMRKTKGDPGKILIVGPPASGKTTLLKDIVRQLSGHLVSVIDSRGEIASCLNGIPQNDVGMADVFDGFNRAKGMMSAIRTMSPEYIVCDEIGDEDDLYAVESCVGAGAKIIATAHAGTIDELYNRDIINKILATKAFDEVVILKGKENPCEISSIHKAGDLYARAGRSDANLLPYSSRFGVLDEPDNEKKGTSDDFANA